MTERENALRLVVMPGDGIGPEITAATLIVLEAVAARQGIGFTFEMVPIGFTALAEQGSAFPAAALARARAADGVILGPVQHLDYPPVAEGGHNPSGEMRRQLDLFANIRPARTRPGLPSFGGRPLDLVIVRENTEGFYADRSMHQGIGEMMPTPDLAIAVRKITRAASRRIAEAAFMLARRRRRQVTAVHKANVFRMSDGLFLEEVRSQAALHPDVAYEEKLVDAMTALLIRDASRFDVIVTTNMYGDILSDQASELAGGLGLAASVNYGSNHAVAQAQHGAAPDIAGRDRANPSALIGSAAMMLATLAERRGDERLAHAATLIEQALDRRLADPATRTADLGGPLGTRAFAEAVALQVAGG